MLAVFVTLVLVNAHPELQCDLLLRHTQLQPSAAKDFADILVPRHIIPRVLPAGCISISAPSRNTKVIESSRWTML